MVLIVDTRWDMSRVFPTNYARPIRGIVSVHTRPVSPHSLGHEPVLRSPLYILYSGTQWVWTRPPVGERQLMGRSRILSVLLCKV